MEDIYNELIKKISIDRILKNEPMSLHTTFKIGGPADIFVKVEEIDELKYITKICEKENTPFTIIGNGSNVLVTDKGIRGVTIRLDLKKIEFMNKNIVKVGAGVLLSKISNEACNNDLSGFEFLCGIPGTIGGAIRMNARGTWWRD